MAPKVTKKEFKKAKKLRQAQKRMGDKFIAGNTQASREAAARQKRLDHAETLETPEDCNIAALKASYPELYGKLLSGEIITAVKDQPTMLIRAIWYGDIDRRHTFNTSISKLAAANSQLPTFYLAEQRDMAEVKPGLLVPYALACLERRITPSKFSDRDAFLEIWAAAPADQDLQSFSHAQAAQFNGMVRDLRVELDAIDEKTQLEGTFAESARDLKEVLRQETEELNKDGMKLAAEALIGDESMKSDKMEMFRYPGYEKGFDHKRWIDICLQMLGLELQNAKRDGRYDIFVLLLFRLYGLQMDGKLRAAAKAMGFEGFSLE